MIFSINGKVVTFRYIKDFMNFLQKLAEVLDHRYKVLDNGEIRLKGKFKSNSKDSHRHITIWVHNLKYDIWALLEPLHKYFQVKQDKTMIIKSKIIRLQAGQFEFRDSLVLTGLSLAKSGIEYDIPEEFRKKSGDWNYDIIRTQESELTDEEMGYAINDVLALEQIIRNLMKLHDVKRIQSLPPTKTGFVRRIVKSAVKNNPEHVDRLNFSNTDETDKLTQRAYHGGISDISRWDEKHYGKGIIGDFDMTSQYPFVLCTQLYPCGDSRTDGATTPEDLNTLIAEGWGFFADVIFDFIELKNDMISPILTNEWYKIYRNDHRNLFFGSRVYRSFSPFEYTLSSVEYQELKKYFNFKLRVVYCERFHMKRLPRVFISTILDAYANKTIYKGDDENETKYRLAKIVVNSIYGICGTSPLFREKTLDTSNWEIRDLTEAELIYKMKHSKPQKRFVDYRWAPFVTSYARSFLGRALAEVGHDAIYCDTDSVKFQNDDHKYDDWFSCENERIIQILKQSADDLGIMADRFMPKDNKGRPRPLGVWDNDSFEGEFYAKAPKDNTKLKHTAAGDKLQITSSGINVSALMNFYKNCVHLKTPKEIFDFYKANSERLAIPPEFSGKLTHKVVDARIVLGMSYYGDDGTTGIIQSSLAETLFPAPFEKIEKSMKNQGYRAILSNVYDKIESMIEFGYDELEMEGENER